MPVRALGRFNREEIRMKSKLLAAMVSAALGLVPAAALAQAKPDAKVDCAAMQKKSAECTQAKATTDECKKAAEAMKSCPKPKKEKKGGC